MTDPMEDLLDRSAPQLVGRGSARDDALRLMVADARDTAHPRKRPRRRGALLTGALTALLVGGAGVAFAGQGFDWTHGEGFAAGKDLTNPVHAYALTLPSGLQCEVRYAPVSLPSDPALEAEINGELRKWWGSSDVVSAADELVPDMIADLREGEHWIGQPDGTRVRGGYGTEYYDADTEYYDAWSAAIARLTDAEMIANGHSGVDGSLNDMEQTRVIKCRDASGMEVIP